MLILNPKVRSSEKMLGCEGELKSTNILTPNFPLHLFSSYIGELWRQWRWLGLDRLAQLFVMAFHGNTGLSYYECQITFLQLTAQCQTHIHVVNCPQVRENS